MGGASGFSGPVGEGWEGLLNFLAVLLYLIEFVCVGGRGTV